ncbi:MAG TPA: hypothetical protein VFY43_04620, partial [Candidatus Limnocylindria bacterium]|nr:hypothetical protein [Candidatus Limnocylindria bacterium]
AERTWQELLGAETRAGYFGERCSRHAEEARLLELFTPIVGTAAATSLIGNLDRTSFGNLTVAWLRDGDFLVTTRKPTQHGPGPCTRGR